MASVQGKRIADHIRDAITELRLKPKTKLDVQVLNDLFSSNRSHVRRVVAVLTTYKVIDHQPTTGAT